MADDQDRVLIETALLEAAERTVQYMAGALRLPPSVRR